MEKNSFSIGLTSAEAELIESIKSNPIDTLNNVDAFHTNGTLVSQLTHSLLNRNAIPTQRLKYFTEPAYNIGGRGKSRQENFIRNAGGTENMIRHGHFLKYLRYFIHGANLPEDILTEFSNAVKECGNITSGDIDPLSKRARELIRTFNLVPKSAADEFYKLSLDLGLDPIDATSIYSSVLKIRP